MGQKLEQDPDNDFWCFHLEGTTLVDNDRLARLDITRVMRFVFQ